MHAFLRFHRILRGGPFEPPLRIVLLLGAAYWALSALPRLLHYLMHTLSRKFEFIRNKTERFSAAMHIENLYVSIRVRLRAWSQRAPLPTRNLFEFLDSLGGKLALAATLSKITNPRTQRKGVFTHVLDVSGGNSTMSFARGELIDGCNGEIESCHVVHAKNNNTTSTRRTDVWAPF